MLGIYKTVTILLGTLPPILASNTECGGILTATSELTNLTFPDQPRSFGKLFWCSLIITAENENDTVQLTSRYFNRYGYIAGNEYLEVYNGNTSDADQYLGISYLKQTVNYQSSTNSLFIKFYTTNNNENWDVFMLQYIARNADDCNNTYVVYYTPMFILSPGYPDAYQSNLECFIVLLHWIEPSMQPQLEVDIVNSDLDGEYPHCDNASVTLYQGGTGQQIGQFCGDSSTTPIGPYYSNGYVMTMVFQTNGDTSSQSFRIRVSHSSRRVIYPKSRDCGSQFLSASINRQFLQSPGYPVRYKANENCRWTITASHPNKTVRIVVIDSDIYTSDATYITCKHDYASAYDGPSILNDTIVSWCGPSLPTLQSTGSAITIQFHTESFDKRKGFKLAYFETAELRQCGGTLNISINENATLTSPNYPGPYPNNQDCNWIIYAPTTMIIEARVWHKMSETCTDYLEIYEGLKSSSSSSGKLCGHGYLNYLSNGHIITVRFHSDTYSRSQGFQMLVKAVHLRDKRELSSIVGEDNNLYSPNYPLNYPTNTAVSWKITTHPNNTIKINVLESSIEKSNGCFHDYVEAFDGSDSNAKSLGRWCGKSEPTKTSSGSVMFLNFKSDASNVDRGFMITYTNLNNHHKKPDKRPSKDANVGDIVGGSIGGACLLTLILSGIGVCVYKRGQRSDTKDVPSKIDKEPIIDAKSPTRKATSFTASPEYINMETAFCRL
ncbi:cubilin-like isoform X2 [Haliotis rubra]|uniref:cubilin-like isoform X2 n=1 Tax=Haliotis rubra TaxID=36100 RepID=UPI001EE5E271|nr:cubilin-like isoform X2 [Haliotis rubra]